MIVILMPRLSDTMTEGVIAAWHKKPGDPVAPGEVLVEIETDKALMEQEAYDAGVLTEILVPAGETVPIGTPIAVLDDGTGGTPDDTEPVTAETTASTAEAGAPASAPSAAAGTEPKSPGEPEGPVEPEVVSGGRPNRLRATPLVRRIARERGIDLVTVTGTGPGGRIVRADLDALLLSADDRSQTETPYVSPADVTRREGNETMSPDERDPQPVPFDAIRQSIAARLTDSGTTIPTFTASTSADVDELLALRSQINQAHAEDGVKVSVNDLLVRAVALALRARPGVNASYSPDGRGQTLLHGRVHIGIAVATPAGLVVPVIRDADRAAIATIATTTRELVAKATDRKLTAVDMSNGTFTISNLGMYDVEHFTALINPPQGAILAVGAVRNEPTLGDDGLLVRKRLTYTLTADHRIIDGALAAEFLATLTGLIESPLRIIT